jgi:hypothetical protein
MHRLTVTVVLAAMFAGLTSAALAGEPPARSESDYEQVRELIRLGWLDLAERSIARMPEASEAALARGWLALRKADAAARTADQARLCQEAEDRLAEYRKAAPADHRLRKQADALEADISQARLRTDGAVVWDPRTPAAEREQLSARIEAAQQKAIAALLKDLQAAEEEYKKALEADKPGADPKLAEAAGAQVRKAFEAYVTASQKCLLEMIKSGEFWPPAEAARQKKLGRQIADLVAEWLRRQNEKYRALTEEQNGVQLFMDYALGHGLALAGEVAKAAEQFDKVLAVEYALVAKQEQALAIWTRAAYYKARTLADAAEKSGKKADWKKALAAIRPELIEPGLDRLFAIKARILKGKCHGRLGALGAADEELEGALKALDQAGEFGPPPAAPKP